MCLEIQPKINSTLMYQRVYRPRNTHTPNEEVANNSSGHGTLQKPNPHTSAEHTRVPKAGRTDTQGTPRRFGSPLPPLALGPLRAPHHAVSPTCVPDGSSMEGPAPDPAAQQNSPHCQPSLAWASAAAAAMPLAHSAPPGPASPARPLYCSPPPHPAPRSSPNPRPIEAARRLVVPPSARCVGSGDWRSPAASGCLPASVCLRQCQWLLLPRSSDGLETGRTAGLL